MGRCRRSRVRIVRLLLRGRIHGTHAHLAEDARRIPDSRLLVLGNCGRLAPNSLGKGPSSPNGPAQALVGDRRSKVLHLTAMETLFHRMLFPPRSDCLGAYRRSVRATTSPSASRSHVASVMPRSRRTCFCTRSVAVFGSSVTTST